uniref:Fuzzy planar cell polarity protein n=2 Tax=Denticeps clupeoides TaxID=299321 RepID=A0AAY4ASG2_9TELE
MFAAGQRGVALSACDTERGHRVAWAVFGDSVALIAVGDDARPPLRRLLEDAWGCMVLVLGRDELRDVRNVERLKRALRSVYPLLDGLLDRAGDRGLLGRLTRCADCLLPPEPAPLQDALRAFAQAAASDFGCLLVGGRVAAATDGWWRLPPDDALLLGLLLRGPWATASSDRPVFLPRSSPAVAFRLLRVTLLPGADACVLCGPEPRLHRAVTELAGRVWAPQVEALRGCLEQRGCGLPASAGVHRDVLALLLIRRGGGRSLSHCAPPPAAPARPTPSPARRWELLGRFYAFAAAHYLGPAGGEAEPQEEPQEAFRRGHAHQPLQCYLVTEEECKC